MHYSNTQQYNFLFWFKESENLTRVSIYIILKLSQFSCFVGDKYMPFLTNGQGLYINAVFVDVSITNSMD